MPASILATVAAALLAAAWLLGRRRPALVRQLDTSAVAALNRAQIALVQGGLDRPAAAPERGDEAASLAVGAPGRFANGAPAPGRGATKTGGWADGWAAGLPPLHAGLIPPGDQRLRFRAQLQARSCIVSTTSIVPGWVLMPGAVAAGWQVVAELGG